MPFSAKAQAMRKQELRKQTLLRRLKQSETERLCSQRENRIAAGNLDKVTKSG